MPAPVSAVSVLRGRCSKGKHLLFFNAIFKHKTIVLQNNNSASMSGDIRRGRTNTLYANSKAKSLSTPVALP